jgi:hypothetical protein
MEPLKVALPLGIGDVFWSTTKFRALSAMFDGRPIHAYINESPNHQTVNFLKLVPSVTEAVLSKRAPFDVWKELPPNHRFPRWSSLAGCANWREFDFVLVANGHLERGLRLETWLPELGVDATEWEYPLNILPDDVAHADRLTGGVPRALLYMSGIGPNAGFHNHRWTAKDWVNVADLLNAEGIRPLLVGAPTPDDLGYEKLFHTAAAGRDIADSAVGQTTVAQYCALIRGARSWTGLNSGGGIVSGMLRTPTVMMWSDAKYPIPGVHPRNLLHSNMQRSWLRPERMGVGDYLTISYGSDDLSPREVVKATLKVMR